MLVSWSTGSEPPDYVQVERRELRENLARLHGEAYASYVILYGDDEKFYITVCGRDGIARTFAAGYKVKRDLRRLRMADFLLESVEPRYPEATVCPPGWSRPYYPLASRWRALLEAQRRETLRQPPLPLRHPSPPPPLFITSP